MTLPDGDVIGQPLVYSEKNWLVCLIQPCIKTKFAGMVMEQRVDDVQVCHLLIHQNSLQANISSKELFKQVLVR